MQRAFMLCYFPVRLTVLVSFTLFLHSPLLSGTAPSSSDSIRFEHLTADQGLLNNNVISIYQDRQGYLWFGTRAGLDRYDGYEFLHFAHDPLDSCSISSGEVAVCYEDTAGTFWVGTGSELNVFDRQNGLFRRLSIKTVNAILQDGHGFLWFGTGDHGLFKYTLKTNTWAQYTHNPKQAGSLGVNHILRLFLDSRGQLWVCTKSGGLDRYDYATDSFVHFVHRPGNPNSLPDNTVTDMAEDNQGRLWIGTYFGGLCHFDSDYSTFNSVQDNSEKYRHVIGKRILRLYFSDGFLWVGTESGFFQCHTASDEILAYRPNPRDPHSLSHPTIMSIMRDRSLVYWVGTHAAGLNRFILHTTGFNHLSGKPGAATTLSHPSVWSFFEDRENQVWIGTVDGLNKWDRRRNTITQFKSNPDDSAGLKPLVIRSICAASDSELWLGQLWGGVCLFNKNTGRCRYVLRHFTTLEDTSTSLVYTMAKDEQENLWLGSMGNGLMLLNEGRFRLFPFPHDSSTKPWVLTIVADKRDRFWLGTWANGLLHFDCRSHRYQDFSRYVVDERYADSDKISAIVPAADSILWLGTCGAGLVKFDLRTNIVSRFLKENGLVDNFIYALVLDEYGSMWIATSQGLSRFDPRTYSFSNFAMSDGLQGMSFNLGAGFRLRDGTLLLGGNNGFNYFLPQDQLNPIAPQIVMQEITVYGEKRALPDAGHPMHLSFLDKSIAFSFAGLHFKNPGKNKYAYMLDGFDKKWNYCGTRRQAFYTNLSPGRYVFRVKAANADGVWNEAGLFWPLEIDMPFYQSRMFWASSVMIFCVSAYGLFHFRLHRLRIMDNARRQEREQIARDFHDGFGHRATKVSWFVQMLKREAETNASAREYLDKIDEGLSDLYIESRAFMWEMNEHKKSLYDLVVELKNHADYLFDDARVSFTIQGLTEEVQRIILTGLERRNLLYIFKEGMHNIVKHASGCRNVCLSVLPDTEQWTVLLKDDGIGFDGNMPMAGQGMCNMKKRAEELAVYFRLESSLGKGTKIILCKTIPRDS